MTHTMTETLLTGHGSVAIDTELTQFERLAGVTFEGGDPMDSVDMPTYMRRVAEFGPIHSDRETERWLSGAELDPPKGKTTQN